MAERGRAEAPITRVIQWRVYPRKEKLKGITMSPESCFGHTSAEASCPISSEAIRILECGRLQQLRFSCYPSQQRQKLKRRSSNRLPRRQRKQGTPSLGHSQKSASLNLAS